VGFAWSAAVLALGAAWQWHALARAGAWGMVFPGGGWPPGPYLLGNAGRSAAALLLGFGLVLLSDAVGRRLSGWAGVRRPAAPARWAAPLLGYLAISTALLGGAAVGLWYPSVLAAAAALVAIIAWKPAWERGRAMSAAAVAGWRRVPWWERVGGVLLTGWLVVLLVPPELAMDCLTYDLTFPQQVLRAHRLLGSDLYSHWAIPLPAEFPFVFPVMCGLDAAARIVGFLLVFAGGMVLWTSLVPASNAGLGAAAVVLALVVPTARSGLVLAKSDSFAIGYALAAVGLLLHAGAFARGPRRAGAFACGSLLLGATVAVKYLALPLAAALAAAVILRSSHRNRGSVLAVGGSAGILPILPWAGKAWCLEADPLPPLGASVLPGLFGDPGTNEGIRAMFLIYLQDVRRGSAFPAEALRIAIPNAWLLVAAIPWLTRLPAGAGVALIASAAGYLGLVAGIRGAIEHVERFCHPVYALWGVAGLAAFAAARAPAGRLAFASRRAAVGAAVALGVLGAVGLGRFEWWPGGSMRSLHNAYLAGRIDHGEMRLRGTLAYGAILPAVKAAVGAEAPARSVLAIGEIQYWDIPARVRTQVLGPPFVWRAVRGAGSARRVAIRFRQADVGWILFNAPLAGWGRFTYSPYVWGSDELRVYSEFVRTHLKLAAFAGRSDPNYGSPWLFEVTRRPGPPAARLLFLPGAERAFTYASLAAVHGAFSEAVRRFRAFDNLPPVASIASMEADALLAAGREREAYPMLKRTIEDGLIDETNLLDLAIVAARLGRKAEALEALARAARVLPLWPERVAAARRKAGL